MEINKTPEQDYLKICFRYDHETGLLYWNTRPLEHFSSLHIMRVWNSKHANKIAGTEYYGYINILVDRVSYRAHRLIWKLIYNEDSDLYIDHINGIRSDNRLCNLRLATPSENNKNQTKIGKLNNTGFIGVHYSKRERKYVAQVRNDEKDNRLVGRFFTLEAAVYYREKAAKERYGEFYTIVEANREQIEKITSILEEDIIKLEEDASKKLKDAKSKTGLCGVRLTPAGKYSVEVIYKTKYYYVGVFNNIEEAALARENKLKELKSLNTTET